MNARFDLAGRTVIITGGGKGIGKVYSQEFAKAGARVVAADIDGAAAKSVAEALAAQGFETLGLATDIASEESTKAMAQAALERFGAIDVLINNASLMSVLPRRSWLEIPVDEWDRVMAVNLRGTFLMIKHSAPRMDGDGAIVNISSVAALMAVTGASAYTAAKGGVLSLTRVAAAELGPGIRVNCICPGTVHTGMPEELFRTRGDGDVAAGVALTEKKYLLARLGQPEEIASTALFLAGPDGSFFTGAVLAADGGVTAQ